MSRKKELTWRKLDNAAKIFPINSNKYDTKVFRFSCRLKEEIKAEILQKALDKTMHAFPMYASIIRKGLFWYYFESTSIKPIVKEETHSPCGPIYDETIKGLLFEVTYYKKRINLEVHHALSDGVGAIQFLRTLVLNYLVMKHKDTLEDMTLSIDYDASLTEREIEYLSLASFGFKNKEIAKILSVTVGGVKKALEIIFQKINHEIILFS